MLRGGEAEHFKDGFQGGYSAVKGEAGEAADEGDGEVQGPARGRGHKFGDGAEREKIL